MKHLRILFLIGAIFALTGCADEQRSTMTSPGPVAPAAQSGVEGFGRSAGLSTIGVPFSCAEVDEVGVRVSEPGYLRENRVGLFVKFHGAPAGQKTVRIWWDYESKREVTQRFGLGEGLVDPNNSTLFNVDRIVEHAYGGITKPTEILVRAQLEIEGREGWCARNRRVIVRPGAMPGTGTGAFMPCGNDGVCTVFVTNSSYNANLGGISGADAKCRASAAGAGLAGTYLAWLSDTTTSPSTRFTRAAVPYVRTDGMIVADNWSDLTDGSLDRPINLTETRLPSASAVFTSTRTDASSSSAAPGETCLDWTSQSHSNTGGVGLSNGTGAAWTAAQVLTCDFVQSLYCFEQ